MPVREQHHVLVVEDEPVTRELLVAYLVRAGFRVSVAEDGEQMHGRLRESPIDLVLLDIELPGESGLELVASIRAGSSAGIIFVTGRADVTDRVVGLELGADDYIVKPPNMRELAARVRAVLRRRGAALREARPEPLRFGEWSLDRERRSLIAPGGEVIGLTGGELAILGALLAAGGRVMPRGELIEVLQGTGASGHGRSLDVLVHRLRRKLGEGGAIVPRILVTAHGVGYRIAAPLD